MVPAVVFSLISLLGLVVTGRLAWAARNLRRTQRDRRRLLREGVEVSGTVVGAGPSGPAGAAPMIRYLTITGQEFTVAAPILAPQGLQEGQTVTVAYDATEPGQMTLAQDPPGTSFTFLVGLCALLAALTLGTLFFAVRIWSGAAGHGFDIPWVDVPGVVLPSNRGGPGPTASPSS